MSLHERKLTNNSTNNTYCIEIAKFLLTFNNLPIESFNSLKLEDKKTIVLFMMKRGYFNNNMEIEEFLRDVKSNSKKINFESDCNYFSLIDTVLNKILRKCFDYYLSKLDEEKLTIFLSKSQNYIKSANKLFWYLFFNDFQIHDKKNEILNFNSENVKEFDKFYNSFIYKKHKDRKTKKNNKRINKYKNFKIKYLNVIFRFRAVKKYLSLFKKNRIFSIFSNEYKQEITNEYLKLNINIDNNANILKSRSFNGCRLYVQLDNCISKIKKYQVNKARYISLKKVKNDLKNLKCPFSLDDYLKVFNYC